MFHIKFIRFLESNVEIDNFFLKKMKISFLVVKNMVALFFFYVHSLFPASFLILKIKLRSK